MDAKTAKPLPPITQPYDFTNIAFLLTTPVVAFAGTIWYVWNYGVTSTFTWKRTRSAS